jgi:hypothetical protein
MNFEYNDTYFFKIVSWIIEAKPGVYKLDSLTKEPEKFKKHVIWYNQCRPDDFNGVNLIGDSEIEIVCNSKKDLS